jgi:hypothetical protein
LPLGVFENGLTESGYLPSSNGVPNAAWYYKSGQPPTLQALQTDFVWGFLLANPIQAPALVSAIRPPAGPAAAVLGAAAPPRTILPRSARERILGP